MDSDIDRNEIITQFPALEVPFSQNVFELRDLTEEEKEIINLTNTGSILNLERADHKILWIEYGKKIHDNEWEQLEKHNIKEYIKTYIEVGAHDLPDEILEKLPKKVQDRYWKRAGVNFETEFTNLKQSDILNEFTIPKIRYSGYLYAVNNGLKSQIDEAFGDLIVRYLSSFEDIEEDDNFDDDFNQNVYNYFAACNKLGESPSYAFLNRFIDYISTPEADNWEEHQIGYLANGLLQAMLENNMQVPMELIKPIFGTEVPILDVLKKYQIEYEPPPGSEKDVKFAVAYATELGERWPEAEPYIIKSQNRNFILIYMKNVWPEGKRWPEIEPIIKDSLKLCVYYAEVLNNREMFNKIFPNVEKELSKLDKRAYVRWDYENNGWPL
jgi:hypothetical protein